MHTSDFFTDQSADEPSSSSNTANSGVMVDTATQSGATIVQSDSSTTIKSSLASARPIGPSPVLHSTSTIPSPTRIEPQSSTSGGRDIGTEGLIFGALAASAAICILSLGVCFHARLRRTCRRLCDHGRSKAFSQSDKSARMKVKISFSRASIPTPFRTLQTRCRPETDVIHFPSRSKLTDTQFGARARAPRPYWKSYDRPEIADPTVPHTVPIDLTTQVPYPLNHERVEEVHHVALIDQVTSLTAPTTAVETGAPPRTIAIPSNDGMPSGYTQNWTEAPPPPPSFRTDSEEGGTAPGISVSRSVRLMNMIQRMRIQMDAMEPPPVYLSGRGGRGRFRRALTMPTPAVV